MARVRERECFGPRAAHASSASFDVWKPPPSLHAAPPARRRLLPRHRSRQVKGGDAVVASSPAGEPAVFDLAAGAPLGLEGLAVALKSMKSGEKAHLKLKPECERRRGAEGGPAGAFRCFARQRGRRRPPLKPCTRVAPPCLPPTVPAQHPSPERPSTPARRRLRHERRRGRAPQQRAGGGPHPQRHSRGAAPDCAPGCAPGLRARTATPDCDPGLPSGCLLAGRALARWQPVALLAPLGLCCSALPAWPSSKPPPGFPDALCPHRRRLLPFIAPPHPRLRCR
jgi:hypothetical protein